MVDAFAFDKHYELPGWKLFLKTAVPKLYNDIRANISAVLEGGISALTTDTWSSCNMMPCMSVTAHYVSKEWNTWIKMLTNKLHAGKPYSRQSGTTDWKVEERQISCITTDNGANIVAAIRQLKWLWLIGHNLNITMNNSPQQQTYYNLYVQ